MQKALIWRESEEVSAMAGFDDPGVFYSEPFFSEEHSEGGDITHTAAQRRFKDFIKTFLDHDNIYSYRLGRPAEV